MRIVRLLMKIIGFWVRGRRSRVPRSDLDSAYAQMAEDKEREGEALEWAEATFKDVADERQ